MPNPIQPNPLLLGLQKASTIGPDPMGEAFTQMNMQRKEAALPNPENKGVSALGGLMDLMKEYAGPVQETLGEYNPMHTPVGGEGLYNIGRGGVRKATDALESAYHNLMPRFGGVGK